ncbi:hypothetical protein GJU43_18420 [Flavobacterium sp. LC2016-23]|uniref:hypothetical protein n=1 Tax=Flavobacterium sp. LC2016-23 TaxID=2666330 RepID=UPI0012B0AB46|nr:hypothetical protein [Flavobacterium sp. LC2016-23]MRX41267.1 hypothetical protein [Flavobacterium sp. LC2016-23]
MKKYLLIIIIMLCSIAAKSQNAYYDAITLRQYIVKDANTGELKFIDPANSTDPDIKTKIDEYFNLINNNYYNSKYKSPKSLHSMLGNSASPDYNPFLEEYLYPAASLSGETDQRGPSQKFNLTAIGKTDVTKFADGLAQFIVDRTKKELQAAFFDRFAEELKNKKYKDIQILFPATFQVIKHLPDIIYSYEPYIEQLREAFGIDLAAIYPHLEYVLKNGQYSGFFNNHLELKSICLTALYYANGLKKGTHIGVLLQDYDPSKYQFSDAETDTIKNNAIQFIQEVSKSLRTNEVGSKEYWVKAEDVKKMMDDPVTFNIYLGLLYQKVSSINVSYTGNITYKKLIENADDAKNFITALVSAIEDAQEELKNIQKADATIEEYAKSFTAATKVLRVFKDSPFIIDFCNTNFKDEEKNKITQFWEYFDTIVDGSNAAFSLYTNIKAKNYSLAMGNATTLYRLRFNPEVLDKKNQNIKKTVNQIIDFLNEKGAFIAAVAKAQNSTEVYSAIDKIAAPVGSSRVKRLSHTNVAVNAYCGFFLGREIIDDLPSDGKDINTYGLTAPVGFSFSKGNSFLPWPFHKIIPAKGWSSSLFVSVIDLGAIAAYRFSNETTEQVPTIQLADIFSPGIFWSVGIPRTPISLSLGGQVGPNLRKVNDTTNDYSKNTYYRFSFSVVVDIPLLNLYTKSK